MSAANAKRTAPRRKWYRRWWAWCLWALLTLLVALMVVGIWAWTQRYALIEDLVVETLADAGFEADLNIVSITRTTAQITNVRLRRDGEDILRSDEMRARYIWPDIRGGQLQSLDLDGTTAWLELGEDWQPSADWLVELLTPGPETQNEPSAGFPEDGVRITDGTLILSSPVGDATFFIDAVIPAADDFKTEITLAPSALAYRGFAAEGAGFATLSRKGPEFSIEGQTQTGVLSNPDVKINDATLRLDGTANLETLSYTGEISINGGPISSKLFAADTVDLNWDGRFSQTKTLTADGQWTIASQAARTPRPKRADELAEILALEPALSVVPVTEHYSEKIVKTVRDFLVGADIAGTGQLIYGPTGFTVSPSGPFIVQTPRNVLSLRPRTDTDFYSFDKEAQSIRVGLDAAFTQPVGLTLTDIQLAALSPNGMKLEGIESFTAQLKTAKNWRAVSSAGRPVRLGPVNARLKYTGETSPRRLSIDTGLSFDGELPGGYVEDLALKGRLDVSLYDARQVIDFIPRADGRITLSRLETPTDWVVESADFKLPPTRGLFTRTASLGKLKAELGEAVFSLTKPKSDDSLRQHLDVTAGALNLAGQLKPNGRQDWQVSFIDAAYASETLPGPDTTASAAEGELTALLAPNAPVEFTLKSPAVAAQTPLVRVSDMQIDMKGTPDRYEVAHSSGAITLIGTEFAETAKSAGVARFPVDGVVQFSNERFTGEASLRVAKAANAEVIVDYEYSGGVGKALVLVPSIKFANGGLQPQVLFPALKGKIASVEGEAQARLNIAFADGAITQSIGNIDLLDVDVGTAPGPISGLNTTVNFTSLLPLETDGPQTLTMKSFNPGLALENGVVTYRLLPSGVGVDSARWPIGNGAFSLDPFTWVYAAEENRVTMRVEDVSLQDFLKKTSDSKIEATGNVVGTFPVVIRGIEVLVDGGVISVPEGGVLRIDPGPTVPVYSQEEAIAVIRENRASEYAALARDALREFEYRQLNAEINGPLDGELKVGLEFDGANQKVLNAQPFRFDISVAGELFNIARSFNSNAQVKSEILRQSVALPEDVQITE